MREFDVARRGAQDVVDARHHRAEVDTVRVVVRERLEGEASGAGAVAVAPRRHPDRQVGDAVRAAQRGLVHDVGRVDAVAGGALGEQHVVVGGDVDLGGRHPGRGSPRAG